MNNFQKLVVKDALEDPEPLTEWEFDFINSLADKDDDYKLSAKQIIIVNRIGQKYL